MNNDRVHPLILEAKENLQQGKMSRRSFLRLATLLGLSLSSAHLLAFGVAPKAQAATTEKIVRGGTLKAARFVGRVDHPARFSMVHQSHPWRHVFDYLTKTDIKGITHPYLLESWSVSDDLKTWTLKLKKGIKFSNGKELTADDVIFNFSQWLSKEVGSSLLGSLSYMDPAGQKKVDDYTVVCNLKNPSVVLPEHLYHYGACILPKEFGGDITREPIGTGPFLMKEYVPGERCRLVARKDYWMKGADGKPLPYLDEIVFVELGSDPAANLAALRSGQVDTVIEPAVSIWEGVKDDPNFSIISTPTAATRVLRVRVDQDPWKDVRVRQALKLCQNRPKILAIALRNQGTIGADSHIAAANGDNCPSIEPYPFDPAKAKKLLADAGFPNGIDVKLSVASDWPESMSYAQVLKQDAEAAGIRITLTPMPSTQYWDGWTDFNMGITWWAHRPLALMMLPLAYTADKDGKPVPWNESRWVNKEFPQLLDKAQAIAKVDSRRDLVCQMQKIMKE
ncbi:MAG: ABC transporter substrate-binding protein, partial [Deltaproteobacteria bacterium]|nr:ABC transporter substrate-binding protein [Deltaproteobacteria bacterium]